MKKRLLALISALIMILPLLAACQKNGENNGPTSDITEVETDDETTEYVKEKYAGTDYDGYKFRIFAISPGEHYQGFIAEDSTEIWYEEDKADALQHAVFTRNLLTEELLNVTITPIWGGSCYTVTDQTKTLVKAGGDEIDVVYCHWDVGLTGCIQALKDAGMDPTKLYTIGVDGCAVGFEQVKEGTQKLCIGQSFTQMTIDTCEQIKKLLAGESIEDVIWTEPQVVTIDTIDSYAWPEW